MPVPTAKYYISVQYPEDRNRSPGVKFLSRILNYYNRPPNTQTRRSFELLCKSIFSSYDVTRNELRLEVLQQYYNKNGYPLSLSDDVVEVNHAKWDSIESITILCGDPASNHLKKIILFARYNGSRQIKFSLL